MGRFAYIKIAKVKIEQIVVLHLFNTKQLTLQGIGTFTLNINNTSPQDNEKDIILPPEAISFTYNPKVTEDDALINTIVQNTKKIKPLASADLDSYLMLGRQFLNIGKPFTIEGLGTLDKSQGGDLEFIPGQYITPKILAPKALKENEGEEISGLFQDHHRTHGSGNSIKIMVTTITILVLLLGAWAIWHFVVQNQTDKKDVSVSSPVSKLDSLPLKDSIMPKPPTETVTRKDDYTFKIVFKQTKDKEIAITALNKMKNYGHKVILYSTPDSFFKVAEPFKLPLSDTTRIKDSLNKYYYLGKAVIEL